MSDSAYKAKYNVWLLFVLLLVSTLNGSDLIVFSVLAQAIKLDLQFSDFQLGLVGGTAFSLFYISLGVPIARLAEKYNRVTIISVATVIWSGMTALCGVATSFWQIALFRFGVGAGEAGFLAPTSSLIADHFPATRRATAMGIVRLGSPLAAVIGAMLAGWVAEHSGWRVAIVLVGLPGVAVGLLCFTTLKEPTRGFVDGINRELIRPTLASVLQVLLKKRAFIHISLAAALALFGASAFGNFLSAYFYRAHGLSFGEAGLVFGIINVVAFTISALIGGVGLDWVAKKWGMKWYALGPATGLLLCAPFFLLGFSATSVAGAVGLLLLGSSCLYIYYVPSVANIQNMMGPRSRATAVALYTVVTHVIGAVTGPFIVGWLSDQLAERSFTLTNFGMDCPGGVAPDGAAPALVTACQIASAQGLRQALMLCVPMFLLAGLNYYWASRTLERDYYSAKVPDTEPQAVAAPQQA